MSNLDSPLPSLPQLPSLPALPPLPQSPLAQVVPVAPPPANPTMQGLIETFTTILFSVFVGLGLVYVVVVAFCLLIWPESQFTLEIKRCSSWTLGIPFSVMASFALVVLLPISSGNTLSFQAFTIKVEGSACQLLFWIVCYLTLVTSIRMLSPAGMLDPLFQGGAQSANTPHIDTVALRGGTNAPPANAAQPSAASPSVR